MNKGSIIFLLMVIGITVGSVSCMQPYGSPYGGSPYGGYGQQQYGGGCSRQALGGKYQKNLMQCHQQMAACQQGYTQYCQKAQKDCQDAQKYAMQMQQCPYP